MRRGLVESRRWGFWRVLLLVFWSASAAATPGFLVDADWLAEHLGDNDLTREPTPAPAPGTVTLEAADPALFAEWTAIDDDAVSRRDPGVVLLDARPHDMDTGEVVRHAIRGGHIPGAVNLVSLDGTDDQSGKWRADQAIVALSTGIPRDKRSDGFRMALADLPLKGLGDSDVRLGNGGWSHWGNERTLPVVEGAEPWGEEYAR